MDSSWMSASSVSPGNSSGVALARIYGLTFILNLVIAFSLAMFIGAMATWQFGLFAGFMAGFTFVAMAFAITYLFESRSLALWAINGGYQTITFSAMGTILGAWH
jgi:hypothetical protein